MDRKDYFKRYYAERKAGIKHGPVKNTSVVDKSTGSRGKEKVMYDPYNFVKVAERLKAEQQKEKEEAKKAKERAAKLKQKRQALNKVKQNQRKITDKVTKEIKGGEKRLAKSAKTLEKVGNKKVVGPLGGKMKVKTLSKITGGAPGLDRGIRSKMYIGKKFNMGGVMRNRGGTFKGVY